jgi:hypothetical protein
VQVDLSPKIFQSKLEGMGETKDHLVCEIAPPTEAVRGFPPGYYDGALLTDESLKARYRVVRVDGPKVYVDRPVREEDFAATDPYGRRMVHLFDFGEGDEVVIHNSTFLRREEGVHWALQTTSDVRLFLPDQRGRRDEGTRDAGPDTKPASRPAPHVPRPMSRSTGEGPENYYRGADGQWHRLEGVPGPDGTVSYPLRLEQIRAGRTTLLLEGEDMTANQED